MSKLVCTNGHDRCGQMYPSPDCPYCERKLTVSEREMRVLGVLVEHYENECNCLYFRYIAMLLSLDEKQVRRAARSLARKGLAEYVRGLFDENYMVAGSGYRCTPAGKKLYHARRPQIQEKAA